MSNLSGILVFEEPLEDPRMGTGTPLHVGVQHCDFESDIHPPLAIPELVEVHKYGILVLCAGASIIVGWVMSGRPLGAVDLCSIKYTAAPGERVLDLLEELRTKIG